jgi:hypothetical protein
VQSGPPLCKASVIIETGMPKRVFMARFYEATAPYEWATGAVPLPLFAIAVLVRLLVSPFLWPCMLELAASPSIGNGASPLSDGRPLSPYVEGAPEGRRRG